MVKDAVKGERLYITFTSYNTQVHRWVNVVDVVDGGYIVDLNGNKAFVDYEHALQRPLREEEKPKPVPKKVITREEQINAHLDGVKVLSEEDIRKMHGTRHASDKEEEKEPEQKTTIHERKKYG